MTKKQTNEVGKGFAVVREGSVTREMRGCSVVH